MNNRNISAGVAFAASQYTKEREYWLNKLSGDLVKSVFPSSFHETDQNEQSIGTVRIRLPGELFSIVTKASNKSDTRLYAILVTGFVILLEKYTGNKDIITGMPIDKQDTEGVFLNTVLALRIKIEKGMTFRESLMQVRQVIVEAKENINYPIETIPYELNMSFSDNGFPLFDIAILLQNIHCKSYIEHLNLNMIVSFLKTDEYIEGVVEYNPSMYQKKTIERIISYFIRILEKAFANVDLEIDSIDILSPAEKKQLLFDFNDTGADYPKERTIHELFRQQVERKPNNMAMVESDGNRSMNYRELDEKSDQLAGVLRGKGTKTGTLAAIMGQRKIEIVIGILGVLKTGAAYLPIDAKNPGDRIKFIMEDSSADVFLTQKHLVDRIRDILGDFSPGNIIALDDEGIYAGKTTELPLPGQPTDLAYVIYTSGTTGKPKGVMIEHHSLVNYITWAVKKYVKGEAVNFPLYSSISFDLTVTSIFTPLLSGRTIVIYRGGDNDSLVERIVEENKVGVIKLTPSHLKLIRNREIANCRIKRLILGGEELEVQLAKEIYGNFDGKVEIYNEYGPTEATVGCMIYRFDPDKGSGVLVPIGLPADNVRIYILGSNRKPLPIGVSGELYVAGDAVARGYLNRQELTVEKFVEDPFVEGQQMYKTGDLAIWLPEGSVEFVGRIDGQVKVRGYRIELGEVRFQLLSHNDIKEAVVICREGADGDKNLYAYVVSDRQLPLPELREYCSKKLIDYMVPTFFVQVEKIPLTINGKVDREALPEPRLNFEEEYIAPRDEEEERLVEIWADVLGLEREMISIDSNFFELGGHSLKATTLAAKIHKERNVRVALAEIFKTSTIRELARYIKEAAVDKFASIEAAQKRDYYPLSSAQKGIYVQHRKGSETTLYNISQVVPMNLNTNDIEGLEKTFKKLIARHESLRTSFELVGENPVQIIHLEVDFAIAYCKADEEEAQQIITNFVRPFDLSQAPLLRVGIIKLKEEKHLLMVDMHHIITDGVSIEIFVKEFSALYNGEELPLLRIQYRDYAMWQSISSEKGKESRQRQKEFWLKEFEGEMPLLVMPTDYPRPAIKTFEGRILVYWIGKELTRKLNQAAEETETTLYMVLLTAFNILLFKYTGQEDLIVGSPTTGRSHADLQNIIGMFINMLPLRNNPRGDKTFRGFLIEVKRKLLDAMENQDYHFEELLTALEIKMNLSRSPLFDVVFAMHNKRIEAEEEEEHSKDAGDASDPGDLQYKFEVGTSKYDMIADAMEIKGKIRLLMEYSTRLFKRSTVENISKHFIEILEQVVENFDIELEKIKMSYDLVAMQSDALMDDQSDFGF